MVDFYDQGILICCLFTAQLFIKHASNAFLKLPVYTKRKCMKTVPKVIFLIYFHGNSNKYCTVSMTYNMPTTSSTEE